MENAARDSAFFHWILLDSITLRLRSGCCLRHLLKLSSDMPQPLQASLIVSPFDMRSTSFSASFWLYFVGRAIFFLYRKHRIFFYNTVV